jgi:hypothetical protein
MHRVDLARWADEVLTDLPDDARDEVIMLIDAVADVPGPWPVGMSAAFASSCWVTFVVHGDVLEVLDVGWAG